MSTQTTTDAAEEPITDSSDPVRRLAHDSACACVPLTETFDEFSEAVRTVAVWIEADLRAEVDR